MPPKRKVPRREKSPVPGFSGHAADADDSESDYESSPESDSSPDSDVHGSEDSDDDPSAQVVSASSSLDSDEPLAAYAGRVQATDDTITWRNQDNFPKRHGFADRPRVTVDTVDEATTPLQFLRLFMTPELMQHICTETNRYAAANRRPDQRGHTRKWVDTTPDEMDLFLSLVILMGLHPKPDMKLYWTRDPVLRTPYFHDMMPRDRFEQILHNLHFNDNDFEDDDRLFKLRPVIDVLTEQFKTVYIPDQDIATDESLWKFKGRLRFKQYNPQKRARFGIKVFKVCQSGGIGAGYTSNFKIYTGQEQSDVPVSQKIVLELNEHLLGKGYNVHLDNWFSSPALFLALHRQKTNVVGTVRLNRKDMPKDLKLSLKKGEIDYRSTSSGLLALVWKDKKVVKMLSTRHTAEMSQIEKRGEIVTKPNCVLSYNLGMGGVDLSDQMATSHSCVRKTIKWYKKVFCYLFDLCLVNAFIVSKVFGYRKRYLDFRVALIKEVCNNRAPDAYGPQGRPSALPGPARLSGRHFPAIIPPSGRRPKLYRRCVLCTKRGQRKETNYECEQCNVSLCAAPCFAIYHTQKNL